MPGVARPVDHGNEPAQRVAQDDRPSNADGVAEGTQGGGARRVDHGNEPAERVAQDDRPSNADGVAEGTHVVGAHLEAPGRRIAPLRTAVTAQVEVDDLRYQIGRE